MNRVVLVILGTLFLIQACQDYRGKNTSGLEEFQEYRDTADTLWRNQSVAQSIVYLDSLHKERLLYGDLGNFVYYVELASHNYYNDTKHPKLKLYADSAIHFIHRYRYEYPFEYARATRLRGDILISYQAYDKAIDEYLKSISFIEENLETCDYVDFDSEVGNLLFSQGRYDGAIFFFRETLKKRILCEKDSIALYTKNLGSYNNIGVAFENLGRLDSAAVQFEKAIIPQRILDMNNHDWKMYYTGFNGTVYGNLGYVYFKLGQFEQAESLLRQSISINKKPEQFYFDALLTEIKLAELYVAQKRFDEAKTTIASLEKETQIQQPDKFNLRLKRLKWLYFDALGKENSEAYKALVDFRNFEDSLAQAEADWRKFDVYSNIQLKQNIASVAELRDQQRTNTLVLIGILVITVLLGIILIQIVKQSRFRKKSLQRLEKFNEKLNASYNELALSHTEKLKLVRVVAHDLRSPISSMVGFADLINGSQEIESIHTFSSMIYSVGNRTMEQIDELIKDEEFKLELLARPISVDEIVNQSVLLCQFQAKQKSQKIKVDLEPFLVKVDSDRLLRVLVNLITNAIKFNHENGQIEISSWKKDSSGIISIKDNGLGIPLEMQSVLFDVDSSKMRKGTQNEESNGLGLVICKAIVEEHEGKIWVESEEGKGSTFFIRLPLHEPE